MNFKTHSFRHALVILNENEFVDQLSDVLDVLTNISDEDIIKRHEGYSIKGEEHLPKSLSIAINELIKERFFEKGWTPESGIFQDSEYQGDTWRLDFAKDDISIEVAFNHSSVIAWNLIKPVLASELNHVQKAIQTKVGVIITATQELKRIGGFDGAIGTYEKYLDYLPPLQNMLTVPLLIIGLEPPSSFVMKHEEFRKGKKIGIIQRL
jgi:hypothetical protein